MQISIAFQVLTLGSHLHSNNPVIALCAFWNYFSGLILELPFRAHSGTTFEKCFQVGLQTPKKTEITDA